MKDYIQYYDIENKGNNDKKIKPIHVTDISDDIREYALIPRNIGYLSVECFLDEKSYTVYTDGAYDCTMGLHAPENEDIIIGKKDFTRVLSYLKRHNCNISKEEKIFY